MSLFEFRLPDIGEGVAEGEVVAWHVEVGDRVREDDAMIEVMTDKAAVVIGAPKTGKIAELLAKIGDTVKVGDVLVVIETGNGAVISSSERSQKPIEEPAKKEVVAAPHLRSVETFERVTDNRDPSDKPLATPATRKLAQELGVDLRLVKPSSGKKITREDVLAYANRSIGVTSEPAPARPSRPAPKPAADRDGEHRVPFIGIRRRIAERLQRSKNTAAHFTFVEECEVDRLMAMRERYRPEAEAKEIELTYLPFIVIATIAALKKYPALNSRLDTETNEIVTSDKHHIGIATGTEQGLIVPVIHNAQDLSLLQIAAQIQRLAAAAHKGELSVAELNGSTFTITSLGKQSGFFATPIINFPNVGILSIHRIKPRPIVRDSQVVIGNTMLLSLSFDHRIVDGQAGAAFTYEVIDLLENPDKLF